MMPLIELCHVICLVGIIIIIIIYAASQASATVGRQLYMEEKQHRLNLYYQQQQHIFIADWLHIV
jgi:type II secretory pathway pseudopilin PulG